MEKVASKWSMEKKWLDNGNRVKWDMVLSGLIPLVDKSNLPWLQRTLATNKDELLPFSSSGMSERK